MLSFVPATRPCACARTPRASPRQARRYSFPWLRILASCFRLRTRRRALVLLLPSPACGRGKGEGQRSIRKFTLTFVLSQRERKKSNREDLNGTTAISGIQRASKRLGVASLSEHAYDPFVRRRAYPLGTSRENLRADISQQRAGGYRHRLLSGVGERRRRHPLLPYARRAGRDGYHDRRAATRIHP